MILPQIAHHAVPAAPGNRCDGRTLQDLAHVHRQPRIESLHHWQGREHGRIVGPSGQDHFCPCLQRLYEGLIPICPTICALSTISSRLKGPVGGSGEDQALAKAIALQDFLAR